MLEKLRELNPALNIKSIDDKSFNKYGRVIEGYEFEQVLDFMNNKSKMPEAGNVYEACITEMESCEVADKLSKNFYGDMPIQVGYCNGQNTSLNGLEYHKCSEINYAVTDFILILGQRQAINKNSFDSNNTEIFFIPEGTALELYQTTLHFAPCKTENYGFKCLVILTKGTNSPLVNKREIIDSEDELLFMKNKWLIAHPEAERLVNNGAYVGIKGNNIKLKI
ncbi:MAG TPA: DUF4867 family protein [Victivallales bacterium]|nr:DUF4867 family protein [Victivallales bacterium]